MAVDLRPAVFLDKDGTLVHDVPFNAVPALAVFAPGVIRGLKRLQAAGFRLIIVSNQSGVAYGLFDEWQVRAMLAHLVRELTKSAVYLDGFLFCPHHPKGSVSVYRQECFCRKPRPGMLLAAAKMFRVSLEESWLIGDILDDVEAASRAGCRSVLINNGNETAWVGGSFRAPQAQAVDFAEAAELILARQATQGGVKHAG